MADLSDLARRLGITDAQLDRMRVNFTKEHGGEWEAKLTAWMRATARETRDRSLFLSRRSVPPYTESPSEAMNGEPEAVPPDEIADYRASIMARQNRKAEELERIGAFVEGCENLRDAANGLDPQLKRVHARELWRMRSAMDQVVTKLRRGIAA